MTTRFVSAAEMMGRVLGMPYGEADRVAKGFLHVTSHVSDPLPAAAGLAVLAVIAEEGLVERARERGEYLLARLRELQAAHEHVGDVRGRGLLVGLELVEDRESRRPADALGAAVTAECLRRGLSMNIVRAGTSANCFRMAPPLTIAEDEIPVATVHHHCVESQKPAVTFSPNGSLFKRATIADWVEQPIHDLHL